MAFSAPVDVPVQSVDPHAEARAAAESLDAEMAVFSPPLGVKVQPLIDDASRWGLDGTDSTAAYTEPVTSDEKLLGDQVPALQFANQLTAVSKTPWTQQDAAQTPVLTALTWANPTPALLTVDAKQLPNASAMEIRRLTNRECMRRARHRQREDYNCMKATAERLEKQYAELCVRGSPSALDATSLAVKTEPEYSKRSAKEEQQQYAAAVALCQRLEAENLHLKASLQQQAAWKQRLLRVMDSTHIAPNGSSPPSPSTPMGIPDVVKADWNSQDVEEKLEALDPRAAAALFDFSPLDESAIGRAIIDNAHVTQGVRASLAAAFQANDPRAKRHDVLGWDVIQRVNGTFMEYTFTKTFKDLDVDAVGEKMWLNDMRMDTFRVILYSLRRLDVLQKISANAYVLGRDVTYPECETVYRSLFMRFRTQVSREIPNGTCRRSRPRTTGFVIGMHSLNRDWSCSSSSPRHASFHRGSSSSSRPGGLEESESLEWLDLALVTEFLTIEDPITGDKYHQIQWFGRTDPKSHAEALRNAPDTLTVCLRTEMLTVGPAVRLLRSSA